MSTQDEEIRQLRELVKMGEQVVEDFMPNIGRCALQDYGRLNTFLIEARKVPPPAHPHTQQQRKSDQ